MTEQDITYIKSRAEYWDKKLAIVRTQCAHRVVERTPFCIEGYSEPTEYRYSCSCLICGTYWTEHQ